MFSSIPAKLAQDEYQPLSSPYLQLKNHATHFIQKFNYPEYQFFITTLNELLNEIDKSLEIQFTHNLSYRTIASSDAILIAIETAALLEDLSNTLHNDKNTYQSDFENYRELCDEIFGNNFPNLVLKLIGIAAIYALTAKLLAPNNDDTTVNTVRCLSVPVINHAATFYLFSNSEIAKKVDALIRAGNEWAHLEHHQRVAK